MNSTNDPAIDSYIGYLGHLIRVSKATAASHSESPDEPIPRMVRQPETIPFSAGRFIVEVKSIYADLVMVEANCCKVDARQYQAALELDSDTPNLRGEQWYGIVLARPFFFFQSFFLDIFLSHAFLCIVY